MKKFHTALIVSSDLAQAQFSFPGSQHYQEFYGLLSPEAGGEWQVSAGTTDQVAPYSPQFPHNPVNNHTMAVKV